MLSLWPLSQHLRLQEHQSTVSPPPLSPEYTGFRLVNGSTACAGRVEVQVLGTWGTLCASRWDLSDAHVLCRQLNCGFAEAIPEGEHFGRETGPVWRDSFHCDGTEAHLAQCPVITLGASPCSHGNTAAVICSGECQKNAALTPFAPCVRHGHPKQGSHGSTRLKFSLHKPWLPQEPSGGLCLLSLTTLLWESRALNGGKHLPSEQCLSPSATTRPGFLCSRTVGRAQDRACLLYTSPSPRDRG